MKRPPIIRIRGIRQIVPSGYVLGRVSPEMGDVELIPMSALTAAAAATGVLPPSAPPGVPHVGIYTQGPVVPGQYFEFAMAMEDGITFPSATDAAIAVCEAASASTVVFRVVYDLAAYVASGYPSGVMATVTFSSGNTTGAVTWEAGSFVVDRGDILRLVTHPTSTDSSISGIQVLLTGTL